MIVTVKEIAESDSFQTQHGLLYGWKFVATDEAGTDHWLGINTKKPDGLSVGKTFDFLASGKMAGIYTLGKRADMNQKPAYGGQATPSAPQAPRTPANAPQGPSRAPTVTDYGREWASLFPRSYAMMSKLALGVAPRDEAGALEPSNAATVFMAAKDFTTSLMIGLQRGDIQRDPTAAEVEAAEAAKQARLEEARKLLAEQEAATAKAAIPAYAPSDDAPGDDSIPF